MSADCPLLIFYLTFMAAMFTVTGCYFNTINTLTADCPISVLQSALDHCAYYENLLSKTIPGSDVWRANHAEGQPIPVSVHLQQILRVALDVNHSSNGAFNVALGAVTALWKFTSETPRVPAMEELESAVHSIDNQFICLEGDTLFLPKGMQLDLGGIAKGYIADQIANELREQGVISALLNFGGNVVTVGCKPDGSPWSIGLQSPYLEQGKAFFAALPCVDGTVVTSGVYERGFNQGGKRYHHLLDPRTGRPVENGVIAVTLLGKDSLLADAVSTACFVLGPEKGLPLAHCYGMSAIYLFDGGKVRYTRGLPIQFADQNS
jgi:FAD:protein FMN transferase